MSRRAHDRPAPIGIFAVLMLLAWPVTLAASGVLINADGERGRGLALPHDDSCVVLTAAHVIERAAKRESEIEVIGPSGESGRARFQRRIGEADDDIALLELTSGASVVCASVDRKRFADKSGAHLVLRLDQGAYDFVPVAILHEGERDIRVAVKGQRGQIAQMMSGAILVDEGVVKGLLIAEPTGGGRLAEVRSLEYLAAELGPWVRGPATLPSIDEAQAVLTRAIEARAASDLGQIAAAETLVQANAGFVGMDLGGLFLAGAALDHGRFAEARFFGSVLGDSSLVNADLARARLDFARLAKADLSSARLERAILYFADADRARVASARAAESNWGGASARQADFRDADLSATSFRWADLTGADFRGADLRQAILAGAILTGARFEGAQIENLDVTATVGSIEQFDEPQRRELCGSLQGSGDGELKVFRQTPDKRYDSGYRLDPIVRHNFPALGALHLLEPCRKRTRLGRGAPVIDGYEDTLIGYLSLSYPSELLDKGERSQVFQGRVDDQLRRLESALQENRVIVARGSTHRQLTAALEGNLGRTTPTTDDLPLDDDTLFLLALRHGWVEPDPYDWQRHAFRWLRAEHPVGGREPSPKAGRWPTFFPQLAPNQALGPDHAELFAQWTRGRAAALPSVFRVDLGRATTVARLLKQRADPRESEPEENDVDPVVISLKDLINASLPEEISDQADGVTTANAFRLPYGVHLLYILALPHPLESYRLELPFSVAQELADGRGLTAALRIRLTDVELYEPQSKGIAVLRTELVGIQLAKGHTRFPAALPTNGRIPSDSP